MKVPLIKLAEAIYECNIHLKRLINANAEFKSLSPLSVKKYKDFNDSEIRLLDQIIYRFTKLQDAMGERLFVSLLLTLEEDVNTLSFIDILNRMEQLRILDSKDDWLFLRKLRNEFSHEYSNELEENVNAVNQLILNLPKIYNIFFQIKKYTLGKFGTELKETGYNLETPKLE